MKKALIFFLLFLNLQIIRASESLDAIYMQAYELRNTQSSESVLLLKQYLELAKDYTYKGSGYFLLADIQMKNGEDHLAMTNLLNALNAYSLDDNQLKVAEVSKSIGSLFYYVGSYEKSIEYFRHSLKLNATDANQILNWYNLAITYRRLANTDSAIYYLKESTLAAQAAKDWDRVSINYNELGLMSLDVDYTSRALSYFREALLMIDEDRQSALYSWVLHNIGDIMLNEGKLDSAQVFFESSLEIMLANEDGNTSELFNSLAKLSTTAGNNASAINYNRMSIAKATNRTDLKTVQNAYQSLIRFYEPVMIDSAYYFSKRLNEKIIKAQNEQFGYELEAKRYQLELIAMEYTERELSKKQQKKYMRIALIIFIGLLFLTGLFVIWLKSVKSKAENKDGSLLRMIGHDAKFYVEMLLFENQQKQHTIDELKKCIGNKHLQISKRSNH
jgi:tetratricopeptide (TPR) repeat protein